MLTVDTQVPEVEECHMIASRFDYLLKVRTADIQAYRRVLGERISALPHVAATSTYVAMETVRGTLDGRPGSFVLQHSGSMQAGAQSLSIGIVPGSGTGELQGIEGALQIRIVDGEHLYTLAYTLPL